MGYFLPSFFQKRILRYALSRLDVLDTDALDLDRLDISWGKRSTVELRDVDVKLEVCDDRYSPLDSQDDNTDLSPASSDLASASGLPRFHLRENRSSPTYGPGRYLQQWYSYRGCRNQRESYSGPE